MPPYTRARVIHSRGCTMWTCPSRRLCVECGSHTIHKHKHLPCSLQGRQHVLFFPFFFHTICEACHWALDGSLSLPRFLHLLICARDSLRGAGESCLKWQEKYVNIRAEDSERKVCVCAFVRARVYFCGVSCVSTVACRR